MTIDHRIESNSYTDHPIDNIEPIQKSYDERAQILSRLFTFVLPSSRKKNGLRSGYLKFVTLATMIRPELMHGLSQIEIAQQLGVTSAAISKQANIMRDQLGGLRSPGMKSDAARDGYRKVDRTKAKPNHAIKQDTACSVKRHDESIDKAIQSAKQKLQTGKPWIRYERVALIERELLTAEGRLTAKGVLWLGDDT